MKKLYFVFIGLLFVAGVGISVYFGIQPRTVPKIQLSSFDNPRLLGEAITQRLSLELQSARLIILGITPGDEKVEAEVWIGFLQSLAQGGFPVDRVLIDRSLGVLDLTFPVETIDFREQFGQIGPALKLLLGRENQRVFIVAPSMMTSQTMELSAASRLRAEFGLDPMSFTAVPLPASRDKEKEAPILCKTGDDLGLFGCIILQKARSQYRKIKISDRYLGLVDQTGLKDYMVMILRPQK